MPEALTLPQTRELIQVLETLRPPDTYWLSMFPGLHLSQFEDIFFDKVDELRLMAAFTAPGVTARVSQEQGFATKQFRPAYVKPKHTVDLSRAFDRMAGEPIGGNLSPQQRFNAIIKNHGQLQKDSIVRRWEWMAFSAAANGTVVISGDDYPTQTLDFGRHADLTSTLTSGDRWSQTTADPIADITALRRRVWQLARTRITRLTMGLEAFGYFIAHAQIVALMSTQYRGSGTDVNRGVATGEDVEFQGYLTGSAGNTPLEIYTHAGAYDDIAGTATELMNTKAVVGTGPGMRGVKCYGAIRHKSALYPVPMFPRTWDDEGDPGGTFSQTHSAPLMVPGQPNATFKLIVH